MAHLLYLAGLVSILSLSSHGYLCTRLASFRLPRSVHLPTNGTMLENLA